MQKNDLRIVKCHFDLTLKELGRNGTWQELEQINVPNDWEYVSSWISSTES